MFLTNTTYSEYYRPEDLCSEGLISNIHILPMLEAVETIANLPTAGDETYSLEQIINDFTMAVRDMLDAEVAFELIWARYMTELGEDYFFPEEREAVRSGLKGICSAFFEQTTEADIDLVGDRWYVIGMRAGRYIILAQATGLELEVDTN